MPLEQTDSDQYKIEIIKGVIVDLMAFMEELIDILRNEGIADIKLLAMRDNLSNLRTTF